MPSKTTNARSLAPSSSPKKMNKGGYTTGTSLSGQRGSTKRYNHRKLPAAKSALHHKRRSYNRPKHTVLLHRLSPPPSSPPGTLLERIGGSIEDEALSALTPSDRIDEEWSDCCRDSMPFSTPPHFYTPEPGEVEQFLESVIGALPAPPSLSGSGYARSDEPLEVHNLPANHSVEDSSNSVSYSPTQTAVNSLSSPNLTLDRHQGPLLGDIASMAPPSAPTIEECKKYLVPVLLASTQARDAGKRLDSGQCLRLLSDDHCRNFFRLAKEMRHQLASLLSQKTPVNSQGWGGYRKRERVDGEVDAWVRKTRSRFDSTNTVISDVSRRDSDITLVDFGAGRLPPKAPRAMLQLASQAVLNKLPHDAQEKAPDEALVASPITQDHPMSARSLIELVHQAVEMSPPLVSTSQPGIEVETGLEQSGHSNSIPSSPTPTVISPSSVDFVMHLPTEPGIWFKQQGRGYAEIVDVAIEVSEEMFYMSKERRPFGLRTHLRLCSIPEGAVAKHESGEMLVLLQEVNAAIDHHALHWPQKGKLVVQVNPESERSKTWLPHALASDPLNVTSYMRPGKNIFRFIQLSDLSDFTFVLAASPPPPEEEWRSWDWESLVERSRTRYSLPASNGTNGLSEFARLSVTVRS